jgi:hypothetical protein
LRNSRASLSHTHVSSKIGKQEKIREQAETKSLLYFSCGNYHDATYCCVSQTMALQSSRRLARARACVSECAPRACAYVALSIKLSYISTQRVKALYNAREKCLNFDNIPQQERVVVFWVRNATTAGVSPSIPTSATRKKDAGEATISSSCSSKERGVEG